MGKEPENFDSLLCLLALKKYEQPPPEFFTRLSEEVTSRLAAVEAEPDTFPEALREDVGWLAGLWRLLEARPILVGAFGVVVCGLMLTGIEYSQRLPQTSDNAPSIEAVLTPQLSTNLELTRTASPPTNFTPGIDPQLPAGIFNGVYLRSGGLEVKPASSKSIGD